MVEDDFIIVHYDDQLYPARVLEIMDDTIKVTHMIKSCKYAWRWPDKPDILTYNQKEIIKIIQPPKPHNKRGAYLVPEIEKLHSA